MSATQYCYVLRKLIAVGLSATVQVAALGAPPVHAHLGGHESEHHRGTQTIHAHFAAHSSPHHSEGRHFDDNDAERTVYLQLFVAESAASFHVAPALVAAFEPIVPVAAPPRELLQVVHGHDPPFLTSLPSRAPPAFLS